MARRAFAAIPAGAVPGHEVAELLVRERLQRRGVEGLRALLERAFDSVLRDHGLPGAGGRRDEHGLAAVERADRLHLEPVQREGVIVLEPLEVDHPASLEAPKAL